MGAPEILPAQIRYGFIVGLDRDVIHAEGIDHFAVHVLCTAGRTVSLQRRGSKPRRNPHRWTSTASGHINLSDCAERTVHVTIEAAIRAAQRELAEELELVGLPRDFSLRGEPHLVGATMARSRSDDGREICNAISFVFAWELEEKLPNVELPAPPDGQKTEVEALRSFSITDIDSAVEKGGIDGAPFADNFRPIWSVARSALL